MRVIPPSAINIWPVINPAWSYNRNAASAATSSGFPTLPTGCCSRSGFREFGTRTSSYPHRRSLDIVISNRPTGIKRVEAEIDAQVGGRYTIIGYADDDTHHVSGIYREVAPNEKLVFTWAWRSMPERESLVTITFKPDGAGTLLTLLHEQFFDEPARDRHNQGWSSAIDKLEKMFA